MPLIRDFIDEHEQVADLGDEALRALEHADLVIASRCVTQMSEILASHWQGEEAGIFAVMSEADVSYAEYVETLVGEHRALAAFLSVIDLDLPAHRERLQFEITALREHIVREEDGLFPASLTALTGDQWDLAISAWYGAHPGESLIAD